MKQILDVVPDASRGNTRILKLMPLMEFGISVLLQALWSFSSPQNAYTQVLAHASENEYQYLLHFV